MVKMLGTSINSFVNVEISDIFQDHSIAIIHSNPIPLLYQKKHTLSMVPLLCANSLLKHGFKRSKGMFNMNVGRDLWNIRGSNN